MVALKSNKSKLFSKKIKKISKKIKDILKEYVECTYFHGIKCPHCGSDNYIFWGGYDRNIYYIDDGKIIHKILHIKRIKCKDCGKTHALLPEYIVPYMQALLDVILAAINDDDISDQIPFSFETINNWKRKYRKLFLPYLKTMFSNENNIINKIFEDIFGTYERFYYVNKKILMMTHKGIFNMACF